jgi:hypothetical protein
VVGGHKLSPLSLGQTCLLAKEGRPQRARMRLGYRPAGVSEPTIPPLPPRARLNHRGVCRWRLRRQGG